MCKNKHGNKIFPITSFKVVCGFHPLSLSISDKLTVPDGKTLGWNIGGLNWPEKENIWSKTYCNISLIKLQNWEDETYVEY
jgi:hypothetical protein